MDTEAREAARRELGKKRYEYRLAVQEKEKAERAYKVATHKAKMAADEVTKAKLRLERL